MDHKVSYFGMRKELPVIFAVFFPNLLQICSITKHR